MNDNMSKFEENKNVNVNEQNAQVENKKSVLTAVKNCITNKYTLIALGTVAIGFLGYKGYQIYKAKKAAQTQNNSEFDDVDGKGK